MNEKIKDALFGLWFLSTFLIGVTYFCIKIVRLLQAS